MTTIEKVKTIFTQAHNLCEDTESSSIFTIKDLTIEDLQEIAEAYNEKIIEPDRIFNNFRVHLKINNVSIFVESAKYEQVITYKKL